MTLKRYVRGVLLMALSALICLAILVLAFTALALVTTALATLNLMAALEYAGYVGLGITITGLQVVFLIVLLIAIAGLPLLAACPPPDRGDNS